MKGKKYDVIFVFETNFQKQIIEYLASTRYSESDYLMIDARQDKIVVNGKVYRIGLNGIKKSLRSVGGILKWKTLSTNELISVGITGINSKLFELIINYDKLILIDDGVGTPVLLNNPDLWLRRKKFVRCFFFDFMLLLLIKGRVLKTTRQLIRRVGLYYTVYDLPYTYPFKTIKVDFFNQKKYSVNQDQVSFMGSPGIEKEKILKILQSIYEKYHKRIDYYPHPRENVEDLSEYESLCRVITHEGTAEEYFYNNGIPGTIISFTSTILLNVNQIGDSNIALFYIYRPETKFSKPYYRLFDLVGIKPFHIS